MTTRARTIALVAAGTIAVGAGGLALRAQENPRAGSPVIGRARVSIDEALSRPFNFPFGDETTLDTVARTLARGLDAQVVLDLAALKRLQLNPEDHVKLDLKDVRLKTGLKL